jgi:RNA polymerase sigma factor, sigma-70 family
MADFTELYESCRGAAERFVFFRIQCKADAEDVLQEIYLSAYRSFTQLRDAANFKPWLIAIARRKCTDYYRRRAASLELPFEALIQSAPTHGRLGRSNSSAVSDTLELLGDGEKQILYLYYFKSMPQTDIARKLSIPLGTVKSRLYSAKNSFRERYTGFEGTKESKEPKGAINMNKLPEYMPEYTITAIGDKPFNVRWEELLGWFIVPRLGEKLSWAIYDFPTRKRAELTEMQVTGRAEVHSIEGVEITAVEHEPMEFNSTGNDTVERRFVAQLTDTHCRVLAESHIEDGVRKYYTFLDGDSFLDNWGFGSDNCGKTVELSPRGTITGGDSELSCDSKNGVIDVCGRYSVEICGKSYDTIRVIDVESYNTGVASVQYIDRGGRTVLWRRYNRDNWSQVKYGKPWTEILPDNERIIINGQTYVHWYDCISDYII